MLPILLEDDHRQQVGACPTPGRRMKRRRRLADLLATPAGELLAHRLDDLPPARDRLQRLGHVLADLRQLVRAAARAGCRRRHHHPLARKMRGQRLAGRIAPGEPLDPHGLRRRLLGRQLILGRARLELVELQFELVEQTLLALRARAEELAPELLDHQLEEGDLPLGGKHFAGAGVVWGWSPAPRSGRLAGDGNRRGAFFDPHAPGVDELSTDMVLIDTTCYSFH